MGVQVGIDPTDLAQAGWAVTFHAQLDTQRREAIEDALKPLLDLRRFQAGELFRVYRDGDGYRPGESKSAFLTRHGIGPGSVDPFKMPYYLLLVGSPEEIPFRFQVQLDIQYAVGRLHFDTPEEYANYAQGVVEAEVGRPARAQRAAFFAVEHPDDQPTYLSANALVKPLAATLAREQLDWAIEVVHGDGATKARLLQLLGGQDTPALLLTASHGLAFPLGHPLRLSHQGALLCQDWPGPRGWQGAIPRDFYMASDDVAADAQPLGMIAFHYAAYSAGTPQVDEFTIRALKSQPQIAPHAFLARLPQRLLGHPMGGALAVAGQVDRVSGFSLTWEGLDVQQAVFESSFRRLMQGAPIGSAMEVFDQRYAELSTTLSAELEEVQFGKQPDHRALAGMWAAESDARSLLIVGDPAVRLGAQNPVM
jgi:hypothetical protein